MTDYVSPTTGNPLEGNASIGFTDPATGDFFTSDQIVGSVEESAFSPLDLVGGGGLVKGGLEGVEAAGAKLFGKKAAKALAKCKTCAKAAEKKAAKKAEDTVYRGDGRSPDEVRDAGGFQGKNPDSPATLDQHVNGGAGPDGTRFVSTSQSPDVATSFGQLSAGPNGSSYLYSIDAKGLGGTDVSGISRFYSEQEVTFGNGVPWSNVQGWQRIDGLGAPGEFVPNPSYSPP